MHADLLQRAASMKGGLVALRKPVMATVGLRSDFPNVFVVVSGKSPFLKTKADASATENKSCCARPLTLFRAGAMPSLTGQVVLFAPPNHAMHADLLQRAASMKGELVAASQTGDGCRWARQMPLI